MIGVQLYCDVIVEVYFFGVFVCVLDVDRAYGLFEGNVVCFVEGGECRYCTDECDY